jgi:hypothetical protein
MEDYLKLQGLILAIQSKHHEFFESNNAIITDYVDLTDGLLTVIKFKNGLPQYIIDDILSEMGK